jgi:hypothetical protein
MNNFLGPFSVNFTTCACICRSTAPYQIEASASGGLIASGLDRTAGTRLCQWQLTAPPGQLLSLSLVNLDIRSTSGSDPECIHDYLELREGSASQGHVLWRKCGSNFSQDEIFQVDSNQLYLVLATGGPSNASFEAQYSDSSRALLPVFSEPAPGSVPVMVGGVLAMPWSTAYPLSAHGTSWVGLYEQGACDDENELRHLCYIAAQTLEPSTSSGVVEFSYADYRNSGYFELRFFVGADQGRTCSVQNRQFNDHDMSDDYKVYSTCQLSAIAQGTAFVAPVGTAPQAHVPGLKEKHSNFRQYSGYRSNYR